MEKAIIFGAGITGKEAYQALKSRYDILFFVDNDVSKHGMRMDDDRIVKSPAVLEDFRRIKLIIASVFWKEILMQLEEYELSDILVYSMELTPASLSTKKELDLRTIDLGVFFSSCNNLECKELTFIPGGSGVLDYMFIREIAKLINCKVYLEIGTYIGESINILTDICEKLYSITAEPGSKYSAKNFCLALNMPDYSDRLAGNKKVEHFYCDSKVFDFSRIRDKIDLYFIDGDHSYAGVYSDTKKVFESRVKDSVVIWHDVKSAKGYTQQVVQAIKDALGDEFENVHVTNNNLCGIYLPERLRGRFALFGGGYSKDLPLYVYDTKLTIHVK